MRSGLRKSKLGAVLKYPFLVTLLLVFLAPQQVQAATLSPIGLGGFSGSQTIETYGLIQTFAPVDGGLFSGVLHNFTIGGIASTDAVIDAGPGLTNNIMVANIEGDANGVLSLLFPSLQSRLGFGWSLSTGVLGYTVTVEFFDGANASLGLLSQSGTPDPFFIGGFFGAESTIPYLRAEVSWLSGTLGPRFAFDNLQFEAVAAAVPEPGTLLLLSAGLMGLGVFRKRFTG